MGTVTMKTNYRTRRNRKLPQNNTLGGRILGLATWASGVAIDATRVRIGLCVIDSVTGAKIETGNITSGAPQLDTTRFAYNVNDTVWVEPDEVHQGDGFLRITQNAGNPWTTGDFVRFTTRGFVPGMHGMGNNELGPAVCEFQI